MLHPFLYHWNTFKRLLNSEMVNFKFFPGSLLWAPLPTQWLSLQHGFTDTLVLKGSDRTTRSGPEPFIYAVEPHWQSKGTRHLPSMLMQPTELWVCNFRIQNVMPGSALGSSHRCPLCSPAFRILMLKLISKDRPVQRWRHGSRAC